MIQFLHPLWLAAAAAILIPVILHFWNDRRGKVLPVGSVVLLTGGSRRAAWSRRLTQLPLLLVRCLLLIALAILMAKPYFPRVSLKGWVLAAGSAYAGSPNAGAPLDEAGEVVVDSLVKAGWERHFFQDSVNYWDGFREADMAAPAGVSFYVLTPGLASGFAGERPVTEREVHWEVYTPLDSVSRWVESAWRVAGDSALAAGDRVRVVEGLSRATGTVYGARVVSGSEVPDGARVDTSVFRVAVYADEGFTQDARYVRAAVRALQQFTQRRIEVTKVSGSGGDWLFWLSERPVNAAGYKHIFRYAAAVARFNADSSGLVWSEAFPVWLEGLFFGRDDVVGRDRRVLDLQQIVPLRGSSGLGRGVGVLRGMLGGAGGSARDGGDEGGGVGVSEKNCAELWVLCIVIFLLIFERILANGKQTT